jgi:D-serine deaminase-like pyridoxal phosphate-dependent protein
MDRAEAMDRLPTIYRHALRLRDAGLDELSIAAPTSWRLAEGTPLTEARPGNYVFHDATQVTLGVATPEECALTVLGTVVSRPTPERAILDIGSKALGREIMNTDTRGFGVVLEHDEVTITALYEEHGIVEAGRVLDLEVGARVEVLPNHSCVTANLHDAYVFRRGEEVLEIVPVAARGWSSKGRV